MKYVLVNNGKFSQAKKTLVLYQNQRLSINYLFLLRTTNDEQSFDLTINYERSELSTINCF